MQVCRCAGAGVQVIPSECGPPVLLLLIRGALYGDNPDKGSWSVRWREADQLKGITEITEDNRGVEDEK